jgi:hypothetical protein
MDKQTTGQIEQELEDLKIQLALKEKALEAQKQAEMAELKAIREQGIRHAWDQLTQELVKAHMITPPDNENIGTERGRKMAETKFNKRAIEIASEVLGLITQTATADADATTRRKNKKLSDNQKAKIEEWANEGLTVAQMNKKLTTDPTPASYQRINNFVKKIKKSEA